LHANQSRRRVASLAPPQPRRLFIACATFGLFRRPRAPIPCHLAPLPLVLHTPRRGARQGVPEARRATGSHPRCTGTRGGPRASARRSRQQASATGPGPDEGAGDGEPCAGRDRFSNACQTETGSNEGTPAEKERRFKRLPNGGRTEVQIHHQ
jgi:hypothetical protein